MFGWIVLAVVGLIGGAAFVDSRKPTWKKLKEGDAVFVPVADIRPIVKGDDTPEAAASISQLWNVYTGGLMAVNVRVINVKPDDSNFFSGDLTGFPTRIKFETAKIVSIDRNGTKIV